MHNVALAGKCIANIRRQKLHDLYEDSGVAYTTKLHRTIHLRLIGKCV